MANKVSVTDLHKAAEDGDLLVLAELLMRTDVHVDVTDAYGRTPLFYAVENDEIRVADWLIFNGADAYKYDHASRSPMSESRGSRMTSVLCQRRSMHGVEFAILMDNAEYEITSIGVIIRTENTFAPCPSYFMCRVVFPSETGAKSLLTPDEICWREIIEYRTSDRNDNSVVHLQLLFMDKPNQFQELIVKHFKASNDILEIKPEIFSDTIEGKEQCCAAVTVKLNNRGLLLLCCRPRTELLPVTPSGGKFVSKLHKSIQLDIPSQAFSKPGNVVLTVDEVSNVHQTDNILSLSHFFNVRHSSGSPPAKDVTVTLPTPEGFKGEGEVIIMSRSGSSNVEDDSCIDDDENGDYWQERSKWSIMDVKPRVTSSSVCFETSKLGLTTPVEVEKWATKANVTTDTARRYIERSHQVICFMAVGKCLKYNTFDIIVECLHPSQVSRRLDEWAKDDYKKLRISGDFHVRRSSRFRFRLHGNVASVYALMDLTLEMFPGQASHQSLILRVKDVDEAPTGSVAILKQSNVGLRLVTHLPLLLEEQLVRRVSDDTLPIHSNPNVSVDDRPQACAILSDYNVDNNDISKDDDELTVSQNNTSTRDPAYVRPVNSTRSDDGATLPDSSKPKPVSGDSFDFSDTNTLQCAQMFQVSTAPSKTKTKIDDDVNENLHLPKSRCSNNNNNGDSDALPIATTQMFSDDESSCVEGAEMASFASANINYNNAMSDNDSNSCIGANNAKVPPSGTESFPLDYDSHSGPTRAVTNDALFKHEIVHWLSEVIIDVWWKVGVYLGFSNPLLTEFDHRQLVGPREKARLLLTEYFRQKEHDEDLGLRKLVDSFHKAHRSDGINCIIEHLHAYQQTLKRKRNGDRGNSRFSRWVVSQEISKAALFQQFDMPAPTSDEFLVNLVMRLQPHFLLGIKLGLTYAETELIRQDPSCIGLEYKMFTMLVRCRQKQGSNVSFFNNLLQALKELELNETKEWIMDYTKKWSDNVSGQRKAFARQLLSIVQRYDE